MIERICPICGKVFNTYQCYVNRGQMKFCSNECKSIGTSGKNNYRYKDKVKKICIECGIEFEIHSAWALRGGGKYCSRHCFYSASKHKIKIICSYCGIEFETTQSRINKTEHNYCSEECYHNSQKKPEAEQASLFLRCCEYCGKEFYANVYDFRNGKGGKFCSRRCYSMYKSSTANSSYSNARGGTRSDIGIYVRSGWEANWARYLNWLMRIDEVVSWEYEPDTFEFHKIKRGTRFYTPDFKILFSDGHIEYHEVKGWMDKKSKTKLDRMARYYPEIKILLVDEKLYKSTERDVKAFIQEWE